MTWHRVKIASSSSMYLPTTRSGSQCLSFQNGPFPKYLLFQKVPIPKCALPEISLPRNVGFPKYPFPEIFLSISILFWYKKSPHVYMDGMLKGSKPSWNTVMSQMLVFCWRLIISTKTSLIWNLPLTNFVNIFFLFIYTFLGKAFILLILRTDTPILQTGSLLYEITLDINANIPSIFDAQFWEFWVYDYTTSDRTAL